MFCICSTSFVFSILSTCTRVLTRVDSGQWFLMFFIILLFFIISPPWPEEILPIAPMTCSAFPVRKVFFLSVKN